MQYGVYSRPKLPRNEYYFTNGGNVTIGGNNTSLYGAAETAMQIGDVMDSLTEFIGASSTSNGQKGIVPAPLTGQQDYWLKGDGRWADIPASRWFYEWPKDLEPSGLGIDGNLHVSDTISTMNLNVEGQAHFWELVIDKARANGGQIIVSPSLFEIDFLDDIIVYPATSGWFKTVTDVRPDIKQFVTEYGFRTIRARRMWMNRDDHRDRTYSEVYPGDMMRCRTFNLEGVYALAGEGALKDVDNTDYWAFVCGTGSGTYTDKNGNEHDGVYMDLAFAFTTTDSDNDYIPIGTTLRRNTAPEVPTTWASPSIYDDLKKATFEVLCGSDNVETEWIEDEYTQDYITDLTFRIRGVTYITAGILGTEYDDDSYASLYEMLKDSALTDVILYGSDEDEVGDVVHKIMGTDGTYEPLMVYQQNYANDVVNATVNGNPSFAPSASGEYEPEFTFEKQAMEDRDLWLFGWGLFEPREGQVLACLGHLTDPDRQNAVVISSIAPIDTELVAPSIAQYTGIDTFGATISQFRYTTIAKNGNIFTGKFIVKNNGAYISVDDMIDLYIEDIETGLETVGIHLDGVNSTMRMVGSVELHQHSDKDDDTLSVWDSQNRKKVEIIPTQIPSRDDITQTNVSTFKSGTVKYNNSHTSTIRKDTVQIEDKHEFLGMGRQVHNEYRYSITSTSITMSGDISFPQINRNDMIDVNNINVSVDIDKAKFRGSGDGINMYTYPNDGRGAYTTVTFRLKFPPRGGQWHVYNFDVGANERSFLINLAEFIDDLRATSSYSSTKLSYEVIFSAYSKGEYVQLISNYGAAYQYFKVNGWSSGSCNCTITPQGESFMQIGTNGMVYSVGNGDYFYAGNDGFEFKYGQNGLSFNDVWGLQYYTYPQIVDHSGSGYYNFIQSQLVICKPNTSSSWNGMWMPMSWDSQLRQFKNGQVITILGFEGLCIYTWEEKRFKIYRYDIHNFGEFDHIQFSTKVDYHVYDTSSYVEIYSSKLQFVVAPDGYYIISGLTV